MVLVCVIFILTYLAVLSLNFSVRDLWILQHVGAQLRHVGSKIFCPQNQTQAACIGLMEDNAATKFVCASLHGCVSFLLGMYVE